MKKGCVCTYTNKRTRVLDVNVVIGLLDDFRREIIRLCRLDL
jgi:hypothetical protein